MLYSGVKKDALKIHKKAVDKYNLLLEKMNKGCESLYEKRRSSVSLISNIEALINAIANSPKEFEASLLRIQAERTNFRKTETYAKEAYQSAVKSGASFAAGVAGGAAFASMAPTAAMWVATTFGTASTGTAISTLSGAAASKAALAWLGGGALNVGGAGVAGGKALLALAGPIGWGISGASIVASAAFLGNKNKKISTEAIKEAKKITIAGAELNESNAKITHLLDETNLLLKNLKNAYQQCKQFENVNYTTLTSNEQLQLGALVNNTLSLAQLLNKTIQ